MSSTAQVLAEKSSVGDRISQRNFDKLARFIYNYSGIKMPPTKLTMLEGRLRKRLYATSQPTFDAYCSYLFDDGGLEQEAIHLIDVVTTNKTDFFREPKHFEFMQEVALPEIILSGATRIRTWSSACSTGAEPYTMAMVLQEFVEKRRSVSYSVLATDLSTEVLRAAQLGIYPQDEITPVARELRKKYVMIPRHSDRPEVRIAPQLRSKVGFARLNLMDKTYPVGDPMQIIFCRNVLIYFDKATQEKVLSRLCNCLAPGGYLFIGHSESVTGFELPLKQVSNTIFTRL